MTDIQESDAGDRKAIAVREWINDKGEKVVAGDPTAVGFRYTYKATGGQVEYLIGPAGKLATMFGIMGGLTKIGNIVNSIVNDDGYDGASDPMPAVSEWLTKADQTGEWREPGDGVARGPKYDKDTLAAALLRVLAGDAKGDVAFYRNKLEDKGYYAKVRSNTKVMAAYHADMAAKGGAVADASSLA